MTAVLKRPPPPRECSLTSRDRSLAEPLAEHEVRVRRRNRSKLSDLSYRNPNHHTLPHVVKFSGGRSSAAMTFLLAEQGILNPQRGDVVLFANTSAEHPGTYEFTAECKRRLEQEFSLPVFWYEFCTVEDASRGIYRRRRSYRLVKPVPIEEDPDGYRSNGEVFEEMLSFQGMLPNPHSRSCTSKLKLHPGHSLLSEWLGNTDGPAHDGHHRGESYINLEESAETYRRNGGTASPKDYITQKQYMMSMPTARPKQLWQDFTETPIESNTEKRGTACQATPQTAIQATRQTAVRASLFGFGPVHFVTLLGLRADEPRRVNRVLSRTLFAEGAGSGKCQISNQPPGEHPYFPLFESGYSARDIKDFWGAADFDLDIPDWAGNCVFCFMKGTESLRDAGQAADERRIANSPSDISWWSEIERRYRREIPSTRGEGISKFGFFGVSGPSFAQVAALNDTKATRYSHGTPACDCTD